MKRLLKKVMMCATMMAALVGFTSCEDDLDIQTNYPFEVEVMPVPTKVLRGQTVEIRCHLAKEGDYTHTLYTIRWFLYDGTGSLRMENDTILQPNNRYLLENETFRLYYTSASTDAHKFIVVVISISTDFTLFENIKAHMIKSYKVHHMLTEFVVSNSVLVSMRSLAVVLNDVVILVKSANKGTKRIMLTSKVDKEFSLHILANGCICIYINALKFRIMSRNLCLCVFDRTLDIVLNIALSDISCRLTVKSSQLLICISTKGIDNLLGNESVSILENFVPNRCLIDNLPVLKTEHFDGIRVVL